VIYQIRLTDTEIDILLSCLESSDVDKEVKEMITDKIHSEMIPQQIQSNTRNKMNEEYHKVLKQKLVESIAKGLITEKEIEIDKMAKETSELLRKDFEELVRHTILDYFRDAEPAKIRELLSITYKKGIQAGVSQVNAIIKSQETYYVYDSRRDVVRNVPVDE